MKKILFTILLTASLLFANNNALAVDSFSQGTDLAFDDVPAGQEEMINAWGNDNNSTTIDTFIAQSFKANGGYITGIQLSSIYPFSATRLLVCKGTMLDGYNPTDCSLMGTEEILDATFDSPITVNANNYLIFDVPLDTVADADYYFTIFGTATQFNFSYVGGNYADGFLIYHDGSGYTSAPNGDAEFRIFSSDTLTYENPLFDFYSTWYTGFTNLDIITPVPYFENDTEERYIATTNGFATSTWSAIFYPSMASTSNFLLQVYDYIDADSWVADSYYTSSTIDNLLSNNNVVYNGDAGHFYLNNFDIENGQTHKYRVRLQEITTGRYTFNKVVYLVASTTQALINPNGAWADPMLSYTEGGHTSSVYGVGDYFSGMSVFDALMTRAGLSYINEFIDYFRTKTFSTTTTTPVNFLIQNSTSSAIHFEFDFAKQFTENTLLDNYLIIFFRPLLLIIFYVWYGIKLWEYIKWLAEKIFNPNS